MSFQEDQENEMEALEAIFEKDFSVKSKSPPSYQVLLEPCPGEGDEVNHVRVMLKVTYPKNYPQSLPQMTIEAITGLNDKKIATMLGIANKAAKENAGEVCIFTVTEAVKEWLADNNEKEKTAHEEMLDRAKQGLTKDGVKEVKEEENEGDEEGEGDDDNDSDEEETDGKTDWKEDDLEKRRAKFNNPLKIPADALVTKESFLKWKADREAEAKAKDEKDGVKKDVVDETKEVKLTGRQLFQKNMARTLENTKAGAGGEQKPGEEVFWFNENVYDDDDIDDLPDSDEEEEENE